MSCEKKLIQRNWKVRWNNLAIMIVLERNEELIRLLYRAFEIKDEQALGIFLNHNPAVRRWINKWPLYLLPELAGLEEEKLLLFLNRRACRLVNLDGTRKPAAPYVAVGLSLPSLNHLRLLSQDIHCRGLLVLQSDRKTCLSRGIEPALSWKEQLQKRWDRTRKFF